MAAIGGGFQPTEEGWQRTGIEQGDGTFRTRMTHHKADDHRTLTITTQAGDGWQLGKLVRFVADGPWVPTTEGILVRQFMRWQDVRALLKAHEPGREDLYCGGAPIRQPRRLDGRERDILCRVLSDIRRAIRERPDDLRRLVHIDRDDDFRLAEMYAVLDGRDD